MTEIERVVSTFASDDAGRRRLDELFAPATVLHVDRRDRRAVERHLDEVDVAVLRGDAWPAFLDRPRLRWVHCGHAGLDGYAPRSLIEQVALTSSAGRSARALAEHAVMFLLVLGAELPRHQRAQRWRAWGVGRSGAVRGLGARSVLVVGAGHTGRATAELLGAFGCRVVGFRRRDEPVDGFEEMRSVEAGDRLVEVVPEVDAVVLAASLNDSSRHLVDRDVVAAMRSDALLVNVARGGLLDEAALVDLLGHGHLGGVGLDVTSVEPLPAGSPLWRAPRTVITPHVTAPVTDREEATFEILAENVRRHRVGTPLLNRLGPDDALDHPRMQRPSPGPLARVHRRVARRLLSRR
ncbi:MAG: NAD(P)-dependent oxidoreductase [Actinomycetota bacterium]